MSKQINFYATEADKKFLEQLLKEVFGEMLDVPSPQGPLATFPPVLYNSSSFFSCRKESEGRSCILCTHLLHW